jgi:hypothetical protein
MKISPDVLMSLFFTVAAGLIVWILKLAIGAIKDAILKRVNKLLEDHNLLINENKNRINTLEKYVEENRKTITFLIETLINKNK